jgi:hypothetical protein
VTSISFKGIRVIDKKFIALEVDAEGFNEKLNNIAKVVDHVLTMWKL